MEKIELTPRETGGTLFKKRSGYSKTVKRTMSRNGYTTVTEVKSATKTRKKKEKEVSKKKHILSKAGRKAKSKGPKPKGDKPKT